jgi:hypothetical protein
LPAFRPASFLAVGCPASEQRVFKWKAQLSVMRASDVKTFLERTKCRQKNSLSRQIPVEFSKEGSLPLSNVPCDGRHIRALGCGSVFGADGEHPQNGTAALALSVSTVRGL